MREGFIDDYICEEGRNDGNMAVLRMSFTCFLVLALFAVEACGTANLMNVWKELSCGSWEGRTRQVDSYRLPLTVIDIESYIIHSDPRIGSSSELQREPMQTVRTMNAFRRFIHITPGWEISFQRYLPQKKKDEPQTPNSPLTFDNSVIHVFSIQVQMASVSVLSRSRWVCSLVNRWSS